jgi:hypothetical protein
MCRSRDLLLRLTVVRENVVHRRFSIPTESDTGRESANDLPEAELPQLVETPSAVLQPRPSPSASVLGARASKIRCLSAPCDVFV